MSTSQKTASAAHDAVDKAAETAEEFERRVREKAEELAESAGDSYHHARKRAGDVGNTICQYVDEKPMAALGIAFVAGIVISSLLRR